MPPGCGIILPTLDPTMRFIRTCALVMACLLLAGVSFSADRVAKNPKRAAVGKLGQLNQPAPIYVKPHKGARILYRGQAQLYVVLKDINANWATLVMANGSNGYVEAKCIESLPYEVNVKKETPLPSSSAIMATRGGFDRTQTPITGDDLGSQIVRAGTQYIGTPYKWGGTDLVGGIDCSGFVQQLFSRAGIRLPRTAQEQSSVGMVIDRLDQLRAGDRLYFTNGDRSRITHTGLYMGNGYFIHSSVGNGGIATNFLSEKWLRILVTVRR